jgi:hypothetical protein
MMGRGGERVKSRGLKKDWNRNFRRVGRKRLKRTRTDWQRRAGNAEGRSARLGCRFRHRILCIL